MGPLLQLLNDSKINAPATSSAQQEEQKKHPHVQAITKCRVEKVIHTNGDATELQTNRGKFGLGKAKLILAMGTLPATTLVLNSFPSLIHVGKRFTAHFMSCITARVPVQHLSQDVYGDIELGAVYVSGEHRSSRQQFHIQLSAIRDGNPTGNVHHRRRHLPDYFASPSQEQLESSKEHIVFVCACLGELDHKNKDNWFRMLSEGNDITCNATLQVIPNGRDMELWDAMDETTLCLLEQLAPSGGLQYWHSGEGKNPGNWKSERPARKEIRHDGLVHEASTMWIGDKDAPVGLDYCLKGTNNVYITGASLWPTAGSWNPVGIIVSMAMDLANKLCK